MVRKIKNHLLNSLLFWRVFAYFTKVKIMIIGEHNWESKRFKRLQGYTPNLKEPKTLNEKIAWLKLNYIEDSFYESSDKYLVHDYLKKKLGCDYAPKLYFVTQNPNELTYENISKFPCIIKVSNGSGANLIVNSKNQYKEKELQYLFKKYLLQTKCHTYETLEHQYDIDKPYIVVEKLLQTKDGGIPNDYKFQYINGHLEFIYCSVDRLGANVRHVYDCDWKRLHFAWVEGADEKVFERYDTSPSIQQPKYFAEMKELSEKLAKDFPLVRIDFYETEDRIYVGEITLHHGSGHDKFFPQKYDEIYGKKLILPEKNR